MRKIIIRKKTEHLNMENNIKPHPVYIYQIIFQPLTISRIPYSIQFFSEKDALDLEELLESLGTCCDFAGMTVTRKKICTSIAEALNEMEHETHVALGPSPTAKGIPYYGRLLRIKENERQLKKQKTEIEDELIEIEKTLSPKAKINLNRRKLPRSQDPSKKVVENKNPKSQ
jgi:hypothetical protein